MTTWRWKGEKKLVKIWRIKLKRNGVGALLVTHVSHCYSAIYCNLNFLCWRATWWASKATWWASKDTTPWCRREWNTVLNKRWECGKKQRAVKNNWRGGGLMMVYTLLGCLWHMSTLETRPSQITAESFTFFLGGWENILKQFWRECWFLNSQWLNIF